MFNYSSGSIQFDGRELSTLAKNEIIRNIGYVSQNPFIFTGSIEENLVYAYKAASESETAAPASEEKIDLDRMILVLQQVGLFVDVMRFGLDSYIEPDDGKTIEKVIRIRYRFRENFGEKLNDYVEFYDRNEYHFNSNVAENILFGTSINKEFSYHLLPGNSRFGSFLKSEDLLNPLLSLGVELAGQAVDILSGVGTADLFFKNSPVPADKLEECESILLRLKKQSLALLPPQNQSFLLSLALNFTPSIHTMSRLSSELRNKILSARKTFPQWSQTVDPHLFTFFSEENYIHGQSILNNIFFGKIKPGLPQAQEIINQSIMHLLVEEDYLEKIAAFGMRFQVGTMGDRLSGGQKQKLAIARVLIKQPKIILMDEATSALDNKSQARIQRLMTTRWKGKRTVIAAVHRLDILNTFDKIAVMKAGKLVEYGTYQELIEQKGILHELIYGRK
jgi:energy-coupling factor transporter ATP-binding protein EcfA2